MYLVTHKHRFEAAHRIVGHAGRCKHLHGHSYEAELTYQSQSLDTLGMVLDFKDVKNTAGKWIDENWDHNVILKVNDPIAVAIGDGGLDHDRVPYVLAVAPTAENMAEELFKACKEIRRADGKIFLCIEVTVRETPNCSATYRHDYKPSPLV